MPYLIMLKSIGKIRNKSSLIAKQVLKLRKLLAKVPKLRKGTGYAPKLGEKPSLAKGPGPFSSLTSKLSRKLLC